VSRAVLAAALILVGCAERALPNPDARDLGGVDLAVLDAASSDLASCGNQHTRTKVTPITIAPLDGIGTLQPGAAARVLVTFPYRSGCDRPGDLEVAVMQGNATTSVAITAYDWIGTKGCSSTKLEVRELSIPSAQLGGNPRIVFQSTTPDGPGTTLQGAFGPMPSCTQRDLGDACQADCQCSGAEPLALCLIGSDGISRCGVPCHSDTQCRGTGTPYCAGDSRYACTEAQACRAASECHLGEHVEGCLCTRERVTAGGLCGCDAQCADGALCTSEGFCARICTGDRTCADPICGGEGCEFCSSGLCVQTVD
jgi:hypothetical protein